MPPEAWPLGGGTWQAWDLELWWCVVLLAGLAGRGEGGYLGSGVTLWRGSRTEMVKNKINLVIYERGTGLADETRIKIGKNHPYLA